MTNHPSLGSDPEQARLRMLNKQILRDAVAGRLRTLHVYGSLRFIGSDDEPLFEQRAVVITAHLLDNASWVASAPTEDQAAKRLERAVRGALERGSIRPDPVVRDDIFRAVAMAHDEITLNTIKEYGRE